jgi:hypothetical protein
MARCPRKFVSICASGKEGKGGKVYTILNRDDTKMVISAQSIEQKEIEGTVTVSELTPDSSRLDIVVDKTKGIDPKVQQKALVDSVMAVCLELGMECTEQKK